MDRDVDPRPISPRSTPCAAMSDRYGRGSANWKPNPPSDAPLVESTHRASARDCSTSGSADRQRRSTDSCSRSTPSAPNRIHGSCSGVPDAAEAAVRAQRQETSAATSITFKRWVERFPTALGWRSLARCRALAEESDAERHFAEAIELADALLGVRASAHPASLRRMAAPAPTADRRSPPPTRCAGNVRTTLCGAMGRPRARASCAPAARAPANATPPRETNSRLRNSTSPASPQAGSRTPRSEPSSSSAPARSTTT